MTLHFVHRLSNHSDIATNFTLSLTAEERLRSRHHFHTDEGQGINLNLKRGTVLGHGDLLQAESGAIVQILAKPEPVMTVKANTALDLLRAAYHLGNRHVPLEVRDGYLRLSPDSVLRDMLQQMGLQVTEEVLPFQPEMGAYGHAREPHHYPHEHHHPEHYPSEVEHEHPHSH